MGNIVRDSPREAQKLALAAREAKALKNLSETRQYLNASSLGAAKHIAKVANGKAITDPNRLTAAKDVLDRTIGKAPATVLVGPAEQTLAILRELQAEEEDFPSLPPERDLPSR